MMYDNINSDEMLFTGLVWKWDLQTYGAQFSWSCWSVKQFSICLWLRVQVKSLRACSVDVIHCSFQDFIDECMFKYRIKECFKYKNQWLSIYLNSEVILFFIIVSMMSQAIEAGKWIQDFLCLYITRALLILFITHRNHSTNVAVHWQ